MALFLTSFTFDGLADFLDDHAGPGPACVITNASRLLDDRAAIVGPVIAALEAAGRTVVPLDVLDDSPAVLADAGVIVISGGDPFRLLADLRAAHTDTGLINAHRRGVPLVGQSAGAMICAPTLTPLRLTSPFTVPPGLDLTGLALTDDLILPHHDRPGRSAWHRRAAMHHGATVPLTVLWDDEVCVRSNHGWHIHRTGRRTRPARPSDAGAIDALFRQASLHAWSSFIERERLQQRGTELVGCRDSSATLEAANLTR